MPLHEKYILLFITLMNTRIVIENKGPFEDNINDWQMEAGFKF